MSDYNPATIDSVTLDALMSRLARYLNRHGGPGAEYPIPPDQLEDVRQSILADWLGDDWTAREFQSLTRHGRTLFPPTLSETGRHLRAMLFHAGRCRRRRWRAEGATERVADKRRDPDGFRGVGTASRAADPARVLAAVESVSGELILSPTAARERAKRRLPLKYRGGVSFVSSRAPKRLRWMKRRNSSGYTVDVVERLPDRTRIEIRRWIRYRFERVGEIPARRVPVSRRPLPEGVTAATLREAIG